MLYKPDWPQVRERYLAWWEGEVLDRVLVQVTAPREGAAPSNWDAFYLARHLDDPERALAEWERHCQATFFGGDYLPNLWTNLGPGIPAAYLGAIPRIGADTVWFEAPDELSLEEIAARPLREDDPWWRRTRQLTELIAGRAPGRYLAGLTDLNSVCDILCHLRGTQRVLFDLMDTPEMVQRATAHIQHIWLECFEELTRIVTSHQEGACNWMSVWFPGRGGDVQCDFSAMLSPRMFEEFVLPQLAEECRALDHSLYHLDGPGQLAHLELLLELPELGGIQWVPGAGNPGTGSPHWFPLYRRILEQGKLLLLQGMDRADVEGVLEAIPSPGLLIETRCDSEQEVRELLATASRLTHD